MRKKRTFTRAQSHAAERMKQKQIRALNTTTRGIENMTQGFFRFNILLKIILSMNK